MRRSGFTVIELCIGMLITAMVAAATATFTMAVVTQWRDGDHAQILDVSLQQARAVIGPIVQSSRQVAEVIASPTPSVFLWQYDSLGGADQKPQLAEMSLIEYDAATQTIYYYQADSTQDLADNVTATQTLTAADLQNPSTVNVFKSQSWLKPPRALLGPGRVVDSSVETSRVTAAIFQSIVSNGVPQLQWTATITRGNTTADVSDTLTLRAPETIATGGTQ